MSKTEKHDKKIWPKLVIALAAAAVYIIAAHFVIQIALVPSFMEKLEMFDTFTQKGYSEQVYTDDIVAAMKENSSEKEEWLNQVGVEKLSITSDDGYKLVAAVFRQTEESSEKWALLLHGYTGWKEEMYSIACKFYKQGYNVLVPDLRCQGESQGDYIGMGYTDRLDNILWLNEILKYSPDAEIVIYGQSMGACGCIHLCAELTQNQPEIRSHVKSAIADSAFCSPITLFKSKVKDWTGLPCFGLVDAAAVLLKIEGGYSLYDAKALNVVGNTDIPILFIQGMDDKIVASENVFMLYDACNSKKDVLTVDGAGHCQSCEKIPDEYYEKVFEWAEKQIN